MVVDKEFFSEQSYRAKDRDKEFVYREIYSGGSTSRKALLDKHGIHPTALSTAVKELREDGFIYEAERRTHGRQGRPEIMLAADRDRLVAYAIFVESREHHAAIVNLSGEVLYETAQHLPEAATNSDLEYLYDAFIADLRKETPPMSNVVGLGISLVGNVNSAKLQWMESGRWPHIKEFSFHKLAGNHRIEIRIGRDLDNALIHELHKNQAYREGSTILMHWGVGIGLAYANEGRIMRSRFGRFGMVGHSFIGGGDGDDSATLESVASLNAVIRQMDTAEQRLTGDEREFAKFLKRQDGATVEPLLTAIRYMSRWIINISLIFFPERILFLGPFAEQPRILAQLEERVRAVPLAHPINRTIRFRAIQNGYRGCLFGSTYPLLRKELKRYLVSRG